MAKGFGQLGKLYNITTYRVSPYQQKVFKGFFTEGLTNTVRRIRGTLFIVWPPFIVAYGIKEWGDAEFVRLQRKNPAEFANDV